MSLILTIIAGLMLVLVGAYFWSRRVAGEEWDDPMEHPPHDDRWGGDA